MLSHRHMIFLPIFLIGVLLSAGCSPKSSEDSSVPKVLEHTSSKPPPGILAQMQRQAAMQSAAQKQKPK